MGLIDQILEEINKLERAIVSCTSIESCFPIQARFTSIVKEAMEAFKAGKIHVEIQSLPLPMYLWAIEELPEKIKNPENLDKIKSELSLFKNSILHILHPMEEMK